MLVAHSHLETLIELLKEKGITSEDELKAKWDNLVESKREEFKKHGITPTSDQGQ
jgi:hypothetical protein